MSPAIRCWLTVGLLTGSLLLAGPVHAEDSGFFDYLFEDLNWPEFTWESSSGSEEIVPSDAGGFWGFVISDIAWPVMEIDPGVSFPLE